MSEIAIQTFYAIDNEAFSVTFSTVQAIGDPIINNSDSPDGTQYVFGAGYSGQSITVDDTGGATTTLEDDDHLNHIVQDGGGLCADGVGIEAESTILLQELDGFGVPFGPIITITVFSQGGVTGDIWGFSSDTPLIIGASYEKVGGDNTGDIDYSVLATSPNGIVDGTLGDDNMTLGYTDTQGDLSDTNANVIFGYDGADTIAGGGGADTIYGDDSHGEGNLPPDPTPGAYDDVIDAGAGADSVRGGYGDDSITGGTGDDTLIGGQGVDTIEGGDNADLIYGDFTQDLDDLGANPGGGTQFELEDTLYDGSGKVTVALKDFSGGDKDLPADVEFLDDVDLGAAPLTELSIKNIGKADDPDVIRFDLSLYNDDFFIKLGTEGAEDRIIFTNATSSSVDADGQTIITYTGADGLTHTVTVEQTIAQIEVVTSTTPGDFSADGDTITAGAGNDTIDGGFGADDIDAGADNDTVYSSSGADTIDGNTGTDSYLAAGGTTIKDETITVTVDQAGDGTVGKTNDATTDVVFSVENFVADENAAEADTITLNGLVDRGTISGLKNSAQGVFTPVSGTPISFGGFGEPTINDILSGTYDPGTGPVSPKGVYQITSGEEDGATLGNISFSNFETINFAVVCFARGTHIATAKGEVRIEDIRRGDKVVTMDHGLQPVRWIGSRIVPADGRFAPVRFAKGALGNTRDLTVSPQHRMLLQGWRLDLLFGESEALVPAKHLVNDNTILRARGGAVEYFHMLFDTHEIVFAEGIPSESFHPAEIGFGDMPNATREEIFELFPELREDVKAYSPAARSSLKGYEAKLLAAYERYGTEEDPPQHG